MLRVRAPWLRLPCSSTVGTPLRLSWRASALAPCLVRVKTRVRPGALVRSTSTGTRCSRDTCSTWWSISVTGDCAESASWVTGCWRNCLTRTLTPLSRVAEKSSRWPCFGVAARSRRTAGRKPRSAMWSASSSTVTSTAPRSQWPCWMRSSSRPGQATTMSTPRRSPCTCGCWPTPPKTVRVVSPAVAASGIEGLLDLADQLTGGREDQGARACAHGAAGRTRRAGPRGAAGTRRSCRSRCGRGRARPGRPASRAAWRPGSGWAW